MELKHGLTLTPTLTLTLTLTPTLINEGDDVELEQILPSSSGPESKVRSSHSGPDNDCGGGGQVGHWRHRQIAVAVFTLLIPY